MKPRLTKVRGIWHCGIKGLPARYHQWIGIGFTPRAAFDDWWAENHG